MFHFSKFSLNKINIKKSIKNKKNLKIDKKNIAFKKRVVLLSLQRNNFFKKRIINHFAKKINFLKLYLLGNNSVNEHLFNYSNLIKFSSKLFRLYNYLTKKKRVFFSFRRFIVKKRKLRKFLISYLITKRKARRKLKKIKGVRKKQNKLLKTINNTILKIRFLNNILKKRLNFFSEYSTNYLKKKKKLYFSYVKYLNKYFYTLQLYIKYLVKNKVKNKALLHLYFVIIKRINFNLNILLKSSKSLKHIKIKSLLKSGSKKNVNNKYNYNKGEYIKKGLRNFYYEKNKGKFLYNFYLQEVTLTALLAVNFQLGFERNRWNPYLRLNIWGVKNNFVVLNLYVTLFIIRQVFFLLFNYARIRKAVLFINENIAIDHLFYRLFASINNYGRLFFTGYRWIGGLLSNIKVILKRRSEKKRVFFNKILHFYRRKNKAIPILVFLLDTMKSKWAINEINNLNIPICGLVDSLTTSVPILYPIVGNTKGLSSQIYFSTLCKLVIKSAYLNEYNYFKPIYYTNLIKNNFKLEIKTSFYKKYNLYRYFFITYGFRYKKNLNKFIDYLTNKDKIKFLFYYKSAKYNSLVKYKNVVFKKIFSKREFPFKKYFRRYNRHEVQGEEYKKTLFYRKRYARKLKKAFIAKRRDLFLLKVKKKFHVYQKSYNVLKKGYKTKLGGGLKENPYYIEYKKQKEDKRIKQEQIRLNNQGNKYGKNRFNNRKHRYNNKGYKKNYNKRNNFIPNINMNSNKNVKNNINNFRFSNNENNRFNSSNDNYNKKITK